MLEIWLQNARCPRLQGWSNVKLAIDMEHEVVPDHPVAANWIFIKLRPVVGKLVAIVKGVLAKGQVTIPGDHVTMLAIGIGICKTPIVRLELAGVQFRCEMVGRPNDRCGNQWTDCLGREGLQGRWKTDVPFLRLRW